MRTIATLFLLLLPTSALAQEPLTWGEKNEGEVSVMGAWTTGFGIGATHDFAPWYGFIGFSGEVMYHLMPQLSIGLASGYQLFRGEGRETFELDNAAVNAHAFKYFDNVPMLAMGRYYLDVNDLISLFGAVGVGTIYTNRVVDTSVASFHTDTWHFGLSPQIGMLIHGMGPEIVVDVEYMVAPGGADHPTEMWFNAELGLLFD